MRPLIAPIVWLVLPALAPRGRLVGDRCIGGRPFEARRGVMTVRAVKNLKTRPMSDYRCLGLQLCLPGATFAHSLCMLIVRAGLFRGLVTCKGHIGMNPC